MTKSPTNPVVASVLASSVIKDKIDLALEALSHDPGAIFEVDVLALLTDVRSKDPARWQRVRVSAKANGVQVSELDKLTSCKDEAKDYSVEMFPDVEPHSDPVNGAVLLDDVYTALASHVIADPPTLTAAVLWSIHTWAMDSFSVSPLANITAPEKRCGKTVMLDAMGKLVYRPLQTSNISSAALFRSVDLWHPCLLIDEVDAFLKENEEARGILNAGLYRDGAYVIRTTGEDFTPTRFNVWSPKVLCGIGALADTLEDRSIPLRMRRKMPGEHVANLRRSDSALWDGIRSRIARWVDDNRSAIANHTPAPAIGLHDRAQDCWEPLLTVADLAGEEWPRRARAHALVLHGAQEDNPSANVELLGDIKLAFEHRGASRLATTLLIELLIEDDEAPWATWNRGRPITARQLSKRLGEFGIKPRPMRTAGSVVKGYDLASFGEVFGRYLAPP